MANILPPINSPASIRRVRIRRYKDVAAKYTIGIGGISVIIAIVLIFFYLLYIVLPLFIPGSMEKVGQYTTPSSQDGSTLAISMEEQNEIGVRITDDAKFVYFDTHSGEPMLTDSLALDGAVVSSFTRASVSTRLVAFGLNTGDVLIAKHDYKTSFPNDKRLITPGTSFPFGQEHITIDEDGSPLTRIAFQDGEDQALLAATTMDGRLLLSTLMKETSFFDDEITLDISTTTIESAPDEITHILLDRDQQILYVADRQGQLSTYDVSSPDEPELKNRISIVNQGEEVTAISFLTGDISLLIGSSTGRISQWFTVRNENDVKELTLIREFQLEENPIEHIEIEYFRKGFIASDSKGNIGIFHSTAQRKILTEKISNNSIDFLGLSPRSSALLTMDSRGETLFWDIDNEHPEVSWSSLWGKVWYESYEEPDYIYQSSGGSDEFEPKLSLVPIAFGTIKAAFYAMLFAMPLAIAGAIYTAYFMTPKMRSTIKPTIEIMEALPTVILGFLAGLWLAPILEAYMPGIFMMLILVPLNIVLFAYAWSLLPGKVRAHFPDGWQAAILIPVVILSVWAAMSLSGPMEALLFNGNMPGWLTNELGIDYDQRNAMVVGIAMGFAVIPTIFSITEDAVFGVPKHLTNGSLALGATQWQTLVFVVLLTASPGIFSAVMIGFGRAVGETMIVLMATGNTPLIDLSIFQGMRTLSANIAVEMPESEVASTHYRILFLAAFVLFTFTFMFNTVAEIVRQRLRKKYSSL